MILNRKMHERVLIHETVLYLVLLSLLVKKYQLGISV